MNTAPIDTYEGAGAYFTFGPGSVGMWVFLIVAFLLFLYVSYRATAVESEEFAEIEEDALGAANGSADGHR